MEIGWIWNADSVLAICVAFDDECGDIRQLWEFDKIVYVGRLSFLVWGHYQVPHHESTH
jgi:hypothetical protein